MKFLAVIAGAGLLGVASQADATIYLSLQQSGVNGGAITSIANDSGTGTLSYSGTYGTFTNVIGAQGVGAPTVISPSLYSIALNSSTNLAGKLTVYITQTNLSSYTGNLVSGFTSNLFSGAAQAVAMSTYVDPANGQNTGNLLATKTFTSATNQGIGSESFNSAVALKGPFSETEKYEITFGTGGGTVADTITLAPGAVPEPASWALMLVGFGFIGTSLRQRRRAAVSFG